jgi:hypothetical protein
MLGTLCTELSLILLSGTQLSFFMYIISLLDLQLIMKFQKVQFFERIRLSEINMQVNVLDATC